jgi:hypothetical protein
MKKFDNIIRLLSLVLLAGVFLVSCGPARKSVAIEEGWELLGEKRVDFGKDSDEFMVNSNHQFTDVRFRVEDREVRIKEFKVVFQNGDKLAPAIEQDFAPGQDSKVIHISPQGRFIRSFEFKYRTKGNVLKGRGSILVFGKRAREF